MVNFGASGSDSAPEDEFYDAVVRNRHPQYDVVEKEEKKTPERMWRLRLGWRILQLSLFNRVGFRVCEFSSVCE